MADVARMFAIRAERRTAIGTAQIVRYTLDEPADQIVAGADCYRIDLAMARRPANARGRYNSHWSADRYERLGGLWMVPPHETVQFRSEAGATTSVHCLIDPATAAAWLEDDGAWSAAALDRTLDMRSERVRLLLARIGEEVRAPGFAGDAMIELLTAQLALEIGRYVRGAGRPASAGGLAGWRLRAIDERLSADGPAPSLIELAALCGLSVRQMTRGFRAARGESVGEAIARRRIERARALLGAGQGIKAIAHDLGFASPAGFTLAFRKATGDTPYAWRARLGVARSA